jgi:hypothetical protein
VFSVPRVVLGLTVSVEKRVVVLSLGTTMIVEPRVGSTVTDGEVVDVSWVVRLVE